MNRNPTRTDLYEEQQRTRVALLAKAAELRTAARQYGDIAESIHRLPAVGPEFQEARDDIAAFAHQRRRACIEVATKAETRARELS